MGALSQLRRLFLTIGIAVSVALVAAGALALGLGYSSHSQVTQQLQQERITFPEAGSEGISALPASDGTAVAQYAGQELTTGPQAKVYSDNYIWVHMQEATQGKSYAEMDRDDPARATALTGDTLRGMLLNAYAWWTIGTYAIIGGFGLLGLGLVMFIVTLVANKRAPKVEFATQTSPVMAS